MKLDWTNAIAANPKPGQYVRFAATGRFLAVENYPGNGLGFLFQKERNGTFNRVFF
jgi:hypothetical protein